MEKNKKLLLGAGGIILILIVIGAIVIGERGGWDRDEGRGRSDKDDRGGMMNHDVGNHQMPDGSMMENTLSERQFIEMMIPHHQEAVDTAKQVVARGENAEVKKLAQNIVTTQEKEIADMKSWYKSWYGVDYTSDDAYHTMMPDLTKLSGNKLDRAFLEGMIEHHTGALEENQRVVPNLKHQEMQTLVTNIAETQSSEIITMRILLKQI